jgi:hypothetical protein
MYARLACATGWSWEYIGQCMTLPRLYAMVRYWNTSAPPMPETVSAIAFGIGALKREEPAPKEGTKAHDAAVADFIRGMPIQVRKRPA